MGALRDCRSAVLDPEGCRACVGAHTLTSVSWDLIRAITITLLRWRPLLSCCSAACIVRMSLPAGGPAPIAIARRTYRLAPAIRARSSPFVSTPHTFQGYVVPDPPDAVYERVMCAAGLMVRHPPITPAVLSRTTIVALHLPKRAASSPGPVE